MSVAKRALLIGNGYTGTANALQGPEYDLKNVETLLGRFGFESASEPAGLKALRNVGKDQMKTELRELVEWANSNSAAGVDSSIVFYFSGHGTSVADQDGDESDGQDEAFVTNDLQLFTDDEFHRSFCCVLPENCTLWVVSDNCRSGTICDLPFRFRDPMWIPTRRNSVGVPLGQGFLSQGFSDTSLKPKATIVCLSGCRDSESSADLGTAGGAMTRAWVKVLSSAEKELRITDVVNGVVSGTAFFGQVPQLTSTHRLARVSLWDFGRLHANKRASTTDSMVTAADESNVLQSLGLNSQAQTIVTEIANSLVPYITDLITSSNKKKDKKKKKNRRKSEAVAPPEEDKAVQVQVNVDAENNVSVIAVENPELAVAEVVVTTPESVTVVPIPELAAEPIPEPIPVIEEATPEPVAVAEVPVVAEAASEPVVESPVIVEAPVEIPAEIPASIPVVEPAVEPVAEVPVVAEPIIEVESVPESSAPVEEPRPVELAAEPISEIPVESVPIVESPVIAEVTPEIPIIAESVPESPVEVPAEVVLAPVEIESPVVESIPEPVIAEVTSEPELVPVEEVPAEIPVIEESVPEPKPAEPVAVIEEAPVEIPAEIPASIPVVEPVVEPEEVVAPVESVPAEPEVQVIEEVLVSKRRMRIEITLEEPPKIVIDYI